MSDEEQPVVLHAVNVRLTPLDAAGSPTGESLALAQETEDEEIRRAELALARRLAAREATLIRAELQRVNLLTRVNAAVRATERWQQHDRSEVER